MKPSLMQHLACPSCGCGLVLTDGEQRGDNIHSGRIECPNCGTSYRIVNGIPRFSLGQNYAASFGFQWNRFRSTQIDSLNASTLSRDRFVRETHYGHEWMRDGIVLDAGCGAGRFLDVARQQCGTLIGVDYSDAVEASYALTSTYSNVHVVQASIYELPFRPGYFDGIYSIGVIQHTPDPHMAIRKLTSHLKTGGVLALTIYERKPWTRLNAKYLIRPLTKRLPPRVLYTVIAALMPVLFSLTYVLFRLPRLGRLFSFVIPVANYSQVPTGSVLDEYRHVLLDTFDMLSPAYDQPLSKAEVDQVLSEENMSDFMKNCCPKSLSGIYVVARKIAPACGGVSALDKAVL